MTLSDLARNLSATWDLLDAPTREEALRGLSAACSDVQRLGSGGHDELLLRQLTPRETDVLAAIGSGASTTQMAEQLGISRDTVRSHVKNVLAKLQVHSRLEAAMMARTTGPR